jgi:hypothetical protein
MLRPHRKSIHIPEESAKKHKSSQLKNTKENKPQQRQQQQQQQHKKPKENKTKIYKRKIAKKNCPKFETSHRLSCELLPATCQAPR